MPDTPLDEKALARMRAITAELSAAGLNARLHSTRGCLDITAVSRLPVNGRPVEAVVDEDDYVELRYWNQPGASPARMAAVITLAVATITEAR